MPNSPPRSRNPRRRWIYGTPFCRLLLLIGLGLIAACTPDVIRVPCGPDPALIQPITIDAKGKTVGDLATSHRNLVDRVKLDNERKARLLAEIKTCGQP